MLWIIHKSVHYLHIRARADVPSEFRIVELVIYTSSSDASINGKGFDVESSAV